ncbi:hypothetical protein GCM10022278_04590 [Allohahella marinimesophila]|uniref:Uncharacterized protein n=1 Tax=Allohahella marinimesophila TaxID=1054972 RepID=A0ABP7NJC4_9GAMM
MDDEKAENSTSNSGQAIGLRYHAEALDEFGDGGVLGLGHSMYSLCLVLTEQYERTLYEVQLPFSSQRLVKSIIGDGGGQAVASSLSKT